MQDIRRSTLSRHALHFDTPLASNKKMARDFCVLKNSNNRSSKNWWSILYWKLYSELEYFSKLSNFVIVTHLERPIEENISNLPGGNTC